MPVPLPNPSSSSHQHRVILRRRQPPKDPVDASSTTKPFKFLPPTPRHPEAAPAAEGPRDCQFHHQTLQVPPTNTPSGGASRRRTPWMPAPPPNPSSSSHHHRVILRRRQPPKDPATASSTTKPLRFLPSPRDPVAYCLLPASPKDPDHARVTKPLSRLSPEPSPTTCNP